MQVMSGYSGHMTSAPVEWAGDTEPKPAPEPLIRVQALVNTVELPTGPDRLADPADARPWLVAGIVVLATGVIGEGWRSRRAAKGLAG